MLDIGWTEILIVMGIAIVVVGPRELPKVLRTVGKWRGKASAYARDFQRSIEDAADYSEMDAVKKEIEEANRELNDAKRDLGAVAKRGEQLDAAPARELLRIIETARKRRCQALRIKDHRGGDHGARPGSAPGLVDAGDHVGAFPACRGLEAEIRHFPAPARTSRSGVRSGVRSRVPRQP